MRARILAAFVLGALASAAFVTACRQDEPAGDPKTPANSPLPKIEKPEEDKGSPKLPGLHDAG